MKNKENIILKDDINFLEYPNWTVGERTGQTELIIEKSGGTYRIATTEDSLPNKFDKVVLNYLLHELFDNTELRSPQITITRFKIAQNVFYGTKSVGKTECQQYPSLKEGACKSPC